VVKWLREQDAEWPVAFCYNEDSTFYIGGVTNGCWTLQCVQWAIANSSSWGTWRCQHYDSSLYECTCKDGVHDDGPSGDELCDIRQAALVFKWAHENGCPCICNDII
jgi:hypothetical protein